MSLLIEWDAFPLDRDTGVVSFEASEVFDVFEILTIRLGQREGQSFFKVDRFAAWALPSNFSRKLFVPYQSCCTCGFGWKWQQVCPVHLRSWNGSQLAAVQLVPMMRRKAQLVPIQGDDFWEKNFAFGCCKKSNTNLGIEPNRVSSYLTVWCSMVENLVLFVILEAVVSGGNVWEETDLERS